MPKSQGKMSLFTTDPNTSQCIFYREKSHNSIAEVEKRHEYIVWTKSGLFTCYS